MKDEELTFKFEERLPSSGPRAHEDLDNFQKMIEYLAHLRDRLEDGDITESEYYLNAEKFSMDPIDPNKEYTVDQLMGQNMNEDKGTEETAELLKDLFPNFSYVKRMGNPKKDKTRQGGNKLCILPKNFVKTLSQI